MKFLRFIRPFFHFGIILLIFFLTYKLRINNDFMRETPFINLKELKIFAVLSAFIFVARGWVKHLYNLDTLASNYIKLLSKVRSYRFISITFISYFGQGFVFLRGVSRFVIITSGILAYTLLFLFDQLRAFFDFQLQKKTGKKILIISNQLVDNGEIIITIKQNFSFPTEFIQQQDIHEIDFANYAIVVALGTFEKQHLQVVFEKIRFHSARFFHISEGYFLEDVIYTPEKINNIIAMEYKHSKLDGRSLIVKRLCDIIGSIIGILLSFPFMLIIALLIKIDSSGPVIYKSKRIGKNGVPFIFYKFRTMQADMCVGCGNPKADKLYQDLISSDQNVRPGVLPKIENDPRITKIGKILRKTSLDELPQLFQVFVGSMSLVGPRPHLPNEVEKYESRMKRVLSIKPGITGYAQVFGRDNLPFEQEARLDLYYIQNWSLIMDLYVIFATFGVVFKGR
ncbi:UDP-phosphate galactose phosphotransferase [candidate division SR1 bacterium]|nr:UDP-phosphate galactose phosphotransferase [candidate division SR1 bacterium]